MQGRDLNPTERPFCLTGAKAPQTQAMEQSLELSWGTLNPETAEASIQTQWNIAVCRRTRREGFHTGDAASQFRRREG